MSKERLKSIRKFFKKYGIGRRALALLDKALTHPSYENRPGVKEWERLEFLGDAVVDLYVCDFLYKNFRDKGEGELSKIKAYIVSTNFLFKVAYSIGLDKLLLLGKGEEKTSRGKERILASALESVCGAIYISCGLKKVFKFLDMVYAPKIMFAVEGGDYVDYKTLLQEIAQRRFSTVPVYETVNVVGPNHSPMFEVKVKVGDLEEYGVGSNKKEAQRRAAEKLYKLITDELAAGKKSDSKIYRE